MPAGPELPHHCDPLPGRPGNARAAAESVRNVSTQPFQVLPIMTEHPHTTVGDLMKITAGEHISLTAADRKVFRLLADKLAAFDPVTQTEEYVMAAQTYSAQLPERIRRAVLDFRRNGNSTGG